MRILVRAHGQLRKYLERERAKWVDLSPEATVAHLLDALGVDRGEISLITVDDRVVQEEARLEEGDEVSIFPPIGGG